MLAASRGGGGLATASGVQAVPSKLNVSFRNDMHEQPFWSHEFPVAQPPKSTIWVPSAAMLAPKRPTAGSGMKTWFQPAASNVQVSFMYHAHGLPKHPPKSTTWLPSVVRLAACRGGGPFEARPCLQLVPSNVQVSFRSAVSKPPKSTISLPRVAIAAP